MGPGPEGATGSKAGLSLELAGQQHLRDSGSGRWLCRGPRQAQGLQTWVRGGERKRGAKGVPGAVTEA